MDMVRLIEIKTKHRMSLSTEEKIMNDYIMEFQRQTKLNELRDKFEKCWEVDE